MRNQLTQDAPTLFLDQYGGRIVASSAAELARKAGVSTARRQYCDKKVGPTVWNGYVCGSRWFTAFKPREVSL